MYSVISKTTVLFVREVRALGIFGLLSLPEIAQKSARFFRGCGSTSFHVRISFATSLLCDYTIKIQLHTRICLVDMSHSLPILDITAMASPALRKDAIPVTVEHLP
jgi:hypothetical protein